MGGPAFPHTVPTVLVGGPGEYDGWAMPMFPESIRITLPGVAPGRGVEGRVTYVDSGRRTADGRRVFVVKGTT